MGWCCIISLLVLVGIVIFLIIHTNRPYRGTTSNTTSRSGYGRGDWSEYDDN